MWHTHTHTRAYSNHVIVMTYGCKARPLWQNTVANNTSWSWNREMSKVRDNVGPAFITCTSVHHNCFRDTFIKRTHGPQEPPLLNDNLSKHGCACPICPPWWRTNMTACLAPRVKSLCVPTPIAVPIFCWWSNSQQSSVIQLDRLH